jgi:hypothetical protein
MSKKVHFYTGLALVTAAVLMFQIIETRILSVISWYYLSFFVISMAMFGLTAGSVWVYLKGDRFSGASLSRDLSYYCSLFAVTSVVSLFTQLNLPLVFIYTDDLVTALLAGFYWGVLVVAIAIPFFYAGVVVSLALTRSPFPIGRVYGVDLIGAAAGCLGSLALLNLTDGPSAVLWVGAIAALGAWLFHRSGIGAEESGSNALSGLFGRPHAIALALAALAAFNSTTDLGISPNYIKGRHVSERPAPIFERWNSFSRIAQYEVPSLRPRLWGPSPRFRSEDWAIEQRQLVIDGFAASSSFRIEGNVEKAGFLAYDLTNLAYYLPNRRSAAVVGVGGGRDVISARLFGVEEVTGIELNPLIMNLLTEEPGSTQFTGIADLPDMAFHVDEARSWFARSAERFDVIQMSLTDTWAATGAGAYTLSENGLYTAEAWRSFLDHLTSPGEVNETGRMLSLAMAVIIDSGTSDPKRHVFLAAAERIATLIVSRAPMPPNYVEILERAAEEKGFQILVSPDRTPSSPVLASIVGSGSNEALVHFTSNLKLDLTPPTDERPFFFNQLPLYNLDKFFRETLPSLKQGVAQGNLRATLTLVTLVGLSLLLVVGTIVVPLRPAVSDVGRKLAFGGTAYFFLIGAGFMFFEIALLQRMSVFLGHPIYSLSIVLFSMILSTGFGSLLSDRVLLDSSPRFVAWALTTAGYLISLNFWVPGVLTGLESSSLLARGALVVAVIAPAGLLLGFGFPTGMRLISSVDPKPTPWFWGINGAAGVLASSLAVLCSMAYGIGTSIAFAAACYLLLIPAAWVVGVAKEGGDPVLAA